MSIVDMSESMLSVISFTVSTSGGSTGSGLLIAGALVNVCIACRPVVFAADFRVTAFFAVLGFAFACAMGFALCAVAFFPVAGFAFALLAVFLVVFVVFAIVYSLFCLTTYE